MSKEITIALTKAQTEFVNLTSSFSLFRGGYGCGKSHLMGFCATRDGFHSSNAIVALYEPDYNLIKSVAIPMMEYWLNEFGVRYTLNKQDHIIYTSSNSIGDFVFKSMDDPDKLVGYETYSSHMDELDTLPMDKAERIWQKVMGRNRQNPKGLPQEHKVWNDELKKWECTNRMYAYTTPEGYKFCYKMWIQNKNPEFKNVQGKTSDNPTLRASYVRQLYEQYPAELAKAYLEGEFVNMANKSVYYNYKRDIHNSIERIQDKETLYIGCDFNVGKTAATVYVRRNGGRDWHAVAELVNLLDTPELIRVIQDRWQSKDHQIIMYPDSSGRARGNANANVSSIALLHAAHFSVRANAKNPLIIDRTTATNKMFAENRLFVNHIECPEVCRCLEQQCLDKNNEPDKHSGHDHQNDASTYPLAFECAVQKPIIPIKFNFMSKGAFHAR